MNEKAIKASRRYLELMGWKHLGVSNSFDVYEDDEGYIVFVNTTWARSNFAESDIKTLRSEAEVAMVYWFTDNEEICDIPVRVDEIQLNILNDNRALIRHKINAINEDWR